MLTSSIKTFIQILLFLYVIAALSQEKAVTLVEDLQKKRTIIYIQNDTNTDKSVFLNIHPKGYRKSAQRPIIKNIPAQKKVQMLILIPLTDVASSYTYDLIVNEELQTMEVDRSKESKKKSCGFFYYESRNSCFYERAM